MNFRPWKPGYCCLCGVRPLPRHLTAEQATEVLLAWTKHDVHPSDAVNRWRIAVETAERLKR